MPRKILPTRTLSEIYALAASIGREHVLLNDYELGAVLAGSDKAPIAAGTLSNMRMRGTLNTPVVRVSKQPRTRLSDAIAWINRKTTPVSRAA